MTELRHDIQATLGAAYRLEHELGGGGMSRVFVAEDVSLGRRVVVKVLAPELAAGLNAERFRREIALAAQLQHPHIVPVLAAGTADALPYFVMPYVGGESLRALLDAGTALDTEQAAAILRDVAKALAFAHAHGVVHRDIKPDNVLLAGGSAVVTDFGIAKAIDVARDGARAAHHREVSRDLHTITLAGTSLGTPAYMAPEQAAGDPDTDHRADIYSFGVMAYELLAGHHPFQDRPPHAMMRAHIAEAPPPLRDAAPDLPDALVDMVMQCLAKDPRERPQTAEELLRALTPVDASGERIGLRRPRHRTRLAVAVIAVAALLIVTVGVGVSRGWFRRKDPSLDDRLVAVTPFRVATADASLHYLREGMLDLLSAKLTGQGGMRATEPRLMLDAWRHAGGSERADLTREDALQLASRLGAGRLLLGDVVGTPTRIVLSAALIDVPGGTERARVSEEGAPDSLAYIVDRLAARLLASTSAEEETRVSQLAGIALPALRAYLDGQAKLRRGDAEAAARDFTRALDVDSTFALAGLGLHMASSWYGDPQLGARGMRIAWTERAKLSPRDRTMLEAVVGPRYPAPSSTREIKEAREEFLRLAPDRAEAWYLLGDQLFHYGLALGIPDARERALAHFKRAMALDSTFVVGYIHLVPLAASLGDTATARRAERLRLAADTSRRWHLEYEWAQAHRRNDMASLRAVWDTIDAEPQPRAFLDGVLAYAIFDGTGARDVPRILQQLLRTAATERDRRLIHRFAHDISLVLGQPSEAQRHLEASADSSADPNVYILELRDALLGDADTALATSAARRLEALDARPIATDSATRVMQRGITRALEMWRLSRGDTSQTRRSLERMQVLTRRDSIANVPEAQLEIALIEATYADLARSPAAPAALARADSLLDQLDYSTAVTHAGRLTLAAFTAARLHERRGDLKGALRAIRRRPEWPGNVSPYLALQLREEGRLATLAGDREGAIRAYQQFLRLRPTPEPRLRAQTDAVRRELTRLEAQAR